MKNILILTGQKHTIFVVILFVSLAGCSGYADNQTSSLSISQLSDQSSGNDRFEPNDEFDTAVSVSPGEYSDLQIVEGESDYFAVELAAGEEATVEINFDNGDGDLDLVVYSPDRDGIVESTSTSDDESVTFTPNTDGNYRVEIYGYNDASAPYALSISQLSDQSSGNDRFEPNNEFDTAVSVSPGEYSGLQIVEGESDYFAVELAAGEKATVEIDFDNRDGDLDLAVYRLDRDRIVGSTSTSDDESVTFTPNTDGNYRVEIYGYNDASASYALSISGPSTPTETPTPTQTPTPTPTATPPTDSAQGSLPLAEYRMVTLGWLLGGGLLGIIGAIAYWRRRTDDSGGYTPAAERATGDGASEQYEEAAATDEADDDTDKTDTDTHETDETTEQESGSPLAAARESLTAAEAATDADNYPESIRHYGDALAQLTTAVETVDSDEPRHEQAQRELTQTRQQLQDRRSRYETLTESTLASADGDIQTALTAEANKKPRLARRRYRQAMQGYDSAVESYQLVQQYDSALQTLPESTERSAEPIAISRNTAAESPPEDLRSVSAVAGETTFSQLGIDSGEQLRDADPEQLAELPLLLALAATGWRESAVTTEYAGPAQITATREAARQRREQL